MTTCLLPAGPVLAQGGDPWLEQAKLIASDGTANGQFGFSVALEGDTAVVGARQADSFQGAVYVLTRSGEEWTQAAKLTASDGAVGDMFGWSVAFDGATILVGATMFLNDQAGASYVFVDDGTTWTEQARLVAATTRAGDLFGSSVALDGDTALVGAEDATVGGFDENGAAYIFTRDGTGAWNEQARLVPDDWPVGICNICPQFGHSVALHEGTALVGADREQVHGTNGAGAGAGAAYVFVRDAGEWIQQARLTPPEPAAVGEELGKSVALRGDTALVGAPRATVGSNSGQGVVRAFARAGGKWSEQQVLTASDGRTDDFFGQSVALLDDSAVIGASAEFAGPGAAYVYALEGGAWNEQQKLAAADGVDFDRFGVSVALSGGTVLAGANQATIDGNSSQGAAYVFVDGTQGPMPPTQVIPALNPTGLAALALLLLAAAWLAFSHRHS